VLHLLGVNVVLGTGLWAVLHRQGGLGVAGAVVLGPLLFVVTGVLFLAFTGVPEGYPTPPETCPGGEPPWWPYVLPGRPVRMTKRPRTSVEVRGRSVSQPDVHPKGFEPLTF
jgi:hypothetical protein